MAISLGDISFGLGPDTRRLRSAIADIQAFGREVSNAARRTSDGARQAEAQLRRQEAASISALMKVQNFQDALARAGAPGNLFNNTTASLQGLINQMTSGQLSALQYQRTMERFNVTMNNAQRQLRTFTDTQKQQNDASKAQMRATADVEAAILRQERALFRAEQAVLRYNAAVAKAGAPTGLTTAPNAALATLQQQIAVPNISPLQQQRAIQQFSAAMQQAQVQLRNFHQASLPITQGGLQSALQKASAAAILLAGPLSGIATRLSIVASVAGHFSLAWAGALSGIAAGTYAFYRLGTAAIDTAKNLQQVEQTLTAVTGSQTIARTEMKYLYETANRAGVSFTQVSKQYSQLSAAAKGTNLEGERTRTIFESIVFAGAKLGLSAQDVDGALRAVQQIMSKGTVQAEELRGQLGDRLPGAMQIMADALGVTTQKLDGMLKKGEVSRSVLVKFADQLKERFAIDPTKQIDTIVAAESRFANAITLFNDSLDKSVGISEGYKNVLNSLANTINFVSGNMQTIVAVLGAVAGGFAGLFAPAIIGGFATMVLWVGRLTTAMIGLNAAVLANPIGGLASLLLRVGTAAAGAYAGFELMNSAVTSSQQSYLTALPPVQQYIQAQTTLKSSIRATTEEYIKQQEALQVITQNNLKGVVADTERLKQSMDAIRNDPGIGERAKTEILQRYGLIMNDLTEKTRGLGLETLKSGLVIQQLQDILKRQTAAETVNRSDPVKDLTNRQTLALKNAMDTIRELNAEAETVFMAPAQKEWLKVQNDINKSVENFRDQLTRAEIPAQQVATLTDQYAEALRKVKEGNYNLEHSVSIFQVLGDVVGRGLNAAIDQLVDGLMEGKDAFEIIRNVGKQVLADLWKTALQMAVANPIKNFLFGTNSPTLGGTGGAGGLVASLAGLFTGGFGGGGNFGAGASVAAARMHGGGTAGATSRFPVPAALFARAPRLHDGLRHDEWPTILQTGEKVIPRGGSKEGGMKHVTNIYLQEGMTAKSEERKEGGINIEDVIISSVNKGISDGRVTQSLQSKFVAPTRQRVR